jgi:hypothetical protein
MNLSKPLGIDSKVPQPRFGIAPKLNDTITLSRLVCLDVLRVSSVRLESKWDCLCCDCATGEEVRVDDS